MEKFAQTFIKLIIHDMSLEFFLKPLMKVIKPTKYSDLAVERASFSPQDAPA